MDRDIRILAVVDCDPCHDTSNIVWSIHNEMILEGLVGLILSFAGGGDKTAGDPAGLVLKGILQGNKIIKKEENKEMDDSIHEELHQMTKDYIYRIGDLK